MEDIAATAACIMIFRALFLEPVYSLLVLFVGTAIINLSVLFPEELGALIFIVYVILVFCFIPTRKQLEKAAKMNRSKVIENTEAKEVNTKEESDSLKDNHTKPLDLDELWPDVIVEEKEPNKASNRYSSYYQEDDDREEMEDEIMLAYDIFKRLHGKSTFASRAMGYRAFERMKERERRNGR